MADHPRFGPAGVPPTYAFMKATLADVPRLLRVEGLDAFEYEAIRWGQKPQIKREHAEELGRAAVQNDILLSVHGSYFINFCGENAVVEASKRRLIACASAAEWMGAYLVVFHPGFYGKGVRSEVFRNCLEVLKDVVKRMQQVGINNVRIGPETSGKPTQVGSLEEVLEICHEIDRTQLVIDWSHLHARDHGRLKTLEDFRNVLEIAEDRIGIEPVKDMHCHFSKIEFTGKGEKRHHVLEEQQFGPDFEMLAKIAIDFKLRSVFICESPLLNVDATKMRDIFFQELQSRKPSEVR
jgi:deoxyribonuclease-4